MTMTAPRSETPKAFGFLLDAIRNQVPISVSGHQRDIDAIIPARTLSGIPQEMFRCSRVIGAFPDYVVCSYPAPNQILDPDTEMPLLHMVRSIGTLDVLELLRAVERVGYDNLRQVSDPETLIFPPDQYAPEHELGMRISTAIEGLQSVIDMLRQLKDDESDSL